MVCARASWMPKSSGWVRSTVRPESTVIRSVSEEPVSAWKAGSSAATWAAKRESPVSNRRPMPFHCEP